MNRVVQILMDRDELSEEEARQMVREVRAEMYEAIEDGRELECEDILADELGLELDYLFDLL